MRSTLITSTAQRMFFAALFALTAPVYAGSLSVSIEVPRLQVSEYHRPYVALWIARENHQVVKDLSVWYDTAPRNNEGEKWVKDMRSEEDKYEIQSRGHRVCRFLLEKK